MGRDAEGVGPAAVRISGVALAVVVLLCVLVGIPRFATYRDVSPQQVSLTDQPDGWYLFDDEADGRDITSELSFDVYSYHAYVEYFRGDFDRYPIFGPWRWRLLPSWIASFTPIEDPAVAFSVVSLGFLVLGGAALVVAAARFGMRGRGQAITGALYAVSFPAVWYGTSGYVDGSLVALLCVALALIHWRRWWALLLVIAIGMVTKETFLIIVPVAASYLWARSRTARDWVPWSTAFATVAVASFVGIRLVLSTPRTLGWMPDPARLSWNLSRPQAVGSFILSCGVVVPVAAWAAYRLIVGRTRSVASALELRQNLHLVVGLGMGLAVALHGFLTAYADGRHVWTAVPFAAVLAAGWIERWLQGPGDASLPAEASAKLK